MSQLGTAGASTLVGRNSPEFEASEYFQNSERGFDYDLSRQRYGISQILRPARRDHAMNRLAA